MNPISAILKLWMLLKSIPWLWRLITNWQDMKALTDSTWGLWLSSRKSGGLPSCDSFDEFMQKLEVIFEKGLIDIPDVDEKIVAEELRNMRMLLTCSIDNERKRRGLENGQ